MSKWLTTAFEIVGLLNKGSAKTPAAPAAGETDQVQPVSSNALNVTRVGGLAAVIAGAGAAALALFEVNKKSDPHSIVVAAYASVGVIVASALLTAAIIIAADIRARAAIAVATSPGATQGQANVKSVLGAGETKTTLDRAYEHLLVDAGAGDVEITLPKASTCAWQSMTVKRTDDSDNKVSVQPVAGNVESLPADAEPLQLYSSGTRWTRL